MKKTPCTEYLLGEKRRLTEEVKEKQERIRGLEHEIREVKASPTFRAGRVITAVPGKIKRVIKGQKA